MEALPHRSLKWSHAIFSLALLLGILPAIAQPSLRLELPTSPAGAPLAEVPQIHFPRLDMALVQAQDQAQEASGGPMRFAIPQPVLITTDTHGLWSGDPAGEGTSIWQLRIRAERAESLNLGFTRYSLPEGARLLIFATDRTEALRPFTAADNKEHGELWTPVLRTGDILLELQVPTTLRSQVELSLTSVNQGYRAFPRPTAAPEKSGSCNVDVACPEGNGWRNQISSVARIVIGGSSLCSGSMVNNTAEDLRPYFLTANHCGASAGNDQSIVVYWNYENSTCRPPGGAASGSNGNGSLAQNQSGTILRANNAASDFALLELEDMPNPAWGVFWAGWDRRTLNPSSAVAIHHPQGDEKRISFENQPLTTTSFGGTNSPGQGTHLRVEDWDLGTTEGGSSGSPLFSPAKRVVGQLHGGSAACGNNLPDWYGRFSVSWARGSTNATRLREWLDPLGIGALTLNGTSTAAPASPDAPTQLIATPLSPSEIQLKWIDNSTNETDFVVEISEDGAAFTVLSTAPSNSTAAIAQDLDAGKTYFFRVQARNGSGTSGFSNIASATTALSVPAAPTNVQATAGSTTQIVLTWNDASTNETGFLVESSQDGNTFTTAATTGPGVELASIDGLAPLTQYFFRVKAQNGSGNSAASNVASAFTFGPGGQVCTPDNNTLCLSGDRFRVTVEFSTPAGGGGVGTAVPLTSDTGYFWFFNEANVEMVIKVLNACSFADRFWVFAGGLTNVEVQMTVVDSLTGAAQLYTNPQSTAFQPIQDTDAFSSCP